MRGVILKISETTFTVNKQGQLKLPSAYLQQMGITPGTHIRVAFLTKDGKQNTFQEFLLTTDSVLENQTTISLPMELLHAAKIESESDIQIYCADGAIVITRQSSFDIDDLRKLLGSLEIATDFLTQLGKTQVLNPEALNNATESYSLNGMEES